MDDRYTWQLGDLTPVELPCKKYILMRHADNGWNLGLLYEHSTVVEHIATPSGAPGVDLVEIEGDSDEDASVLANFQLRRLIRGLEHRSNEVFATLEKAREEAGRVANYKV